MTEKNKIEISIKRDNNGNKWLSLNELGNTGLLRATTISKSRQVLEDDGHHCNQVSVKTSIKYRPKKYWIT